MLAGSAEYLKKENGTEITGQIHKEPKSQKKTSRVLRAHFMVYWTILVSRHRKKKFWEQGAGKYDSKGTRGCQIKR